MFTQNAYNSEFASRVAFLDCSEASRTMTGDRRRRSAATAARRARLHGARATIGPRGAGLDPCIAMRVVIDIADGQERELVFTSRLWPRTRRCARPRRPVSRHRAAAHVALEGVVVVLESNARRRQRADARSGGQHPRERMVDVSGARMPDVGTKRVLSVRRRLRVPRSAPGRDGARPRRARCCASRSAPRGVATVSRGRRPALVAPAAGRGVRTHISDDYLWLPYALSLRRRDRRYRRPRRPARVPRWRAVKRRRRSYYDLPRRSASPRRSTTIACARSNTASGSARTACR